MRSAAILTAVLTLASTVSAGGFGGLQLRGSFNFGCGKSIKEKASNEQKGYCSSPGSFFSEFKGGPICCSDKTRQPPSKGNTCPFGWGEHFHAGCCIPPKEVSPCDCGEGYHFDKSAKKCVKNGGKCHGGQWWHDRSGSCCDDSWQHNPPKGDCPKGVTCPRGWFWHKQLKRCKPEGPRSPEPDCDDWDDNNHCCGGHNPHPSPKPKPGNGGGGHQGGSGGKFPWGGKFNQADFENWWSQFSKGNNGGWGGWHKRELQDGQKPIAIDFPQTDLDKMYCPGSLHACTVPTAAGGEWSYECVDFLSELESCGGCASTGEGVDCTSIPHADSVGCELGVCQVYTCKSGFVANGTSCAVA
ncbi:hypothetical protein I316_06580 [Kwoniella heveanensis BCC8398]|uniref:Protein CPL1-like domain-containing protein n=1 Tax=Kwoniella heveanensis BCC8398 TaxID=1296120 RepID=A0A1B9GLC0_9TREE|nr:hypothetical protein I316_06580 [Kwoniella heveanensis BCC8398]